MLKRSVVAVLALSAASAGICAAADSRFYGVAGVGRSTIDIDNSAVDRFALQNGLTTSSTSSGSEDTAWKVQFGFPIGNSFAIEVGYMNLGRAKFTNTNNLYTAAGEKKADLFNLDLVGQWYFTQSTSLLVRFGGYRWETESIVPTSIGMTNRNDDGYDFKFGAGLQYDFNKSFALRGAYDRFNGIGSDTTTGDSKVNLLSLDAVLKF